MSIIALIAFLSMFVQINIVSAIEISSSYEGDNTKYILPTGEEFTPKYGEVIRLEGVDYITVVYPTLDMLGLRNHLELTSDDLGAPGPDDETGFGKINVVKSLSVEPPKKK